VPRSAIRSTWTITSPRALCTAVAIGSASAVSASRSIVTLPLGSAVVPRSSDIEPERPVEQAFLAADREQLDLWGSRTWPPLLTSASTRPARIR
jgi:hypothetical protein